jgi:hypothetical protein
MLIPDVDSQLVQLVLDRSMYTTQEEQDAGTLALPIQEQSGDHSQPLLPAGPMTRALAKLLQRTCVSGLFICT